MPSSSSNKNQYDVVIIGAGWSGIFALKHCLEKGMKTIVLEGSNEPGGQWVFRPNTPGGVLKTTNSVSSKLFMGQSDFPLPDHIPEFPSADEIHQHFKNYMNHFNLHDSVLLNTFVKEVSKTGDGKWAVNAFENGNEMCFIGAKLVVATGANLKPKYPKETMYQAFEGTTSHIAEYKGDVSSFQGKRVLLVGGSDSGADMAHDIKEVAKNVSVSLRKGAWFQGRDFGEFYPEYRTFATDQTNNRLVQNIVGIEYIKDTAQKTVTRRWGESGSAIPEWKNTAGYINTYYVKSRHLVHDVHAGKVDAKRAVKDIKGKKVYFEGQADPVEFDHIVFATGYHSGINFKAPFKQNNDRYKLILDVDEPSVAWLGCCRPYLTSFVMIIEMQSLWLANAFANDLLVSVPKSDVERRNASLHELAYLKKRFPQWNYDEKLMYLIDPYRYCDDLANDMGLKPNLMLLFFQNPIRWFKLITCCWSQYHYFLVDEKNPRKQAIAQDEIEKVMQHPVSGIVRGDVLFALLWMPFLAILSTIFGRKNAITRSFKNIGILLLKTRPISVFKIEDMSVNDLTLCLLGQLAMADEIFSTRKIKWLTKAHEQLGVTKDLDELLTFSRITQRESMINRMKAADRSAAQAKMCELIKFMANERVLSEVEKTWFSETVHQLSKGTAANTDATVMAHFDHYSVIPSEKPQAVVLLLGWLGANKKHLKKYIAPYGDKTTTSILTIANYWDCVTGNERNLAILAKKIIDEAANHLRISPGIPLITHAFSGAGPILLGQLNRILQEECYVNENACLVKERMKLQIFDCGPVSPKLEHTLRGIQTSISNPFLRILPMAALWCIIKITDVRELLEGRPSASSNYWNLMKDAKIDWLPRQAYIYIKGDKICNYLDLEDLISHRQLHYPKTRIATLRFDTGGHCNLLREQQSADYCRFIQEQMKIILSSVKD